jgi:quercetin dioxygenase-like cupin family protein
MKSSLIIATGIALASLSVSAFGQGQKNEVIFVSADQASFKESPTPGVSMATVWGDPDKGAHGQFTKFKPGFDAGMHTHSSTLSLVVIKGAYIYRDEAGEKRVGPGGFIRIPAGHKHWSGGDPLEGALFYEEGDGKFDKIDAK